MRGGSHPGGVAGSRQRFIRRFDSMSTTKFANMSQRSANLPGPRAEALIDRDKRVMSPSLPRSYPLVIDHAKGADVWDVDGNRFIDFMTGIAVASTGHCHPEVVQAI